MFFEMLIFSSSVCLADCDKVNFLKLVANIGYTLENDSLFDCKTLPYKNEEIIGAFFNNSAVEDYFLIVLIFNKKTNKLVSKFEGRETAFRDSDYPTEIEIDLAPYNVAIGKRAFGVRITHGLNSWERATDLNLFLKNKDKIDQILKAFEISSSFAHLCNTFESKGILIFSQSVSNKYFDIVVKSKENSKIGDIVNHSQNYCNFLKTNINEKKSILRYKNGLYRIESP
jgi:hypothetical protein